MTSSRKAYHAAWYLAHRDEHRARRLKYYYALDGVAYNKVLLQNRRLKAIRRMAKRHVPKDGG